MASHYTKSKLPGVGISIGLTRLFWQLREAGLIGGIAESSVQAMVALMDEAQLPEALDIARHLRAGGINTEVQMEARKVGKQFQYASRAGIRFVVLAGEDELARGVVAVKAWPANSSSRWPATNSPEPCGWNWNRRARSPDAERRAPRRTEHGHADDPSRRTIPHPRPAGRGRPGAPVELDPGALAAVRRAADFLAEQVRREEPIYGVSTGFGSNADKLLGAHPLRDELPGAARSGRSLHEELQRNLIITHAVCVGEPMAADVVRAMLCIRINTLLKGHSGIRVETLQALAAMLNAGVVPVVPQLGSVGASGDLAPLSHTWRLSCSAAARRSWGRARRWCGSAAPCRPAAGVAVVQGGPWRSTTAPRRCWQWACWPCSGSSRCSTPPDLAAAMTIDAFAGRLGAFAEEVHALRPHPG